MRLSFSNEIFIKMTTGFAPCLNLLRTHQDQYNLTGGRLATRRWWLRIVTSQIHIKTEQRYLKKRRKVEVTQQTYGIEPNLHSDSSRKNEAAHCFSIYTHVSDSQVVKVTPCIRLGIATIQHTTRHQSGTITQVHCVLTQWLNSQLTKNRQAF